ncbi:MAG: UDP-N-acetylmuramate dehydrogenase [Oscillospiraceae bacterium]|nr:UDP-N-acetylmuramate dehydrogenase [Oscillospiraceae bacterium]
MNTPLLKQALRDACPTLEVLENEPLSRHTSFRIGGPAALLANVKTEAELAAALRTASRLGVEPFLLGNGTNVLADDGPIDRLVLRTAAGLDTLERTGESEITCGAGVTLARAAVFALQNGLTGLEFAHGIPGTVGGGMVMNAGAYGGELKDVAVESRYLTLAGEPGVLTGEAQALTYRHSAYSDGDKCVTAAVFRLAPGEGEEIRARMEQLAEKRRSSQPLDKPSAGSTFKRPVGGFAAALIDQCGLKGLTVGGAQVSPKHAGFVVNIGGATCADVLRLTDQIRETVLRETGIALELEIRRLR